MKKALCPRPLFLGTLLSQSSNCYPLCPCQGFALWQHLILGLNPSTSPILPFSPYPNPASNCLNHPDQSISTPRSTPGNSPLPICPLCSCKKHTGKSDAK